jgi:hypothetical protein
LWVTLTNSNSSAAQPVEVAFRASQTGDVTTSTSFSANYPDETQINDIMILGIATDLTSVADGVPPDGWTLFYSINASTDSTLHIFWKRATVANPPTETWTNIFSVNNSGAYAVASYSGVVTTGSPFNASNFNSSGFTSTWTASVTTTVANSRVVAIFGADPATGLNVNWPEGVTERIDYANTGLGFLTFGDVLVSAPSVRTIAVSPIIADATASDSYAAAIFSLTPAPIP